MYYKDVGDEYVYQKRLRKFGYKRVDYLTFGCGFGETEINPALFREKYQPNNNNIRDWRKAIKKFIDNELKYKKYKIVKAVGYWKDLWDFVYEIYVSK